MPSEICVEWVNGDKGRQLFRKRRAAEIRNVQEMYPDRPESEIVAPIEEDSCWDWVEMDECIESRSFPNVGMAMGWARQNSGLDAFGTPRIYMNEWADGDDPSNAVTTLSIEYQGDGQWLDTDTGRAYERPTAAARKSR